MDTQEVKHPPRYIPKRTGKKYRTNTCTTMSIIVALLGRKTWMSISGWLDKQLMMVYTWASFPGSSAGKESACNAETWVWSLGWENTLEEGMATYSSTLAWKVPWTEEPGRLQSMGSLKVRHDWVTSLSLFTFMHWRRKWQPTPMFLSGESQGQGSLVGCRL